MLDTVSLHEAIRVCPCELQDVHDMEGNVHPGRRSSSLLASPMLAHHKVKACAQGRQGR